MLILQMNLDDSAVLMNQDGQEVAIVRVASLVQFPTHTAVRLGFQAPKSVRIIRCDRGQKELNNGHKSANPKPVHSA